MNVSNLDDRHRLSYPEAYDDGNLSLFREETIVGLFSTLKNKLPGGEYGSRKKRSARFTPPPKYIVHKPVISLTIQYRSRGQGLGTFLAEKFGFKLYDSEILDLISEQSKISRSTLDALDQDSSLGFNFLVNSLLGSPYVVPQDFAKDLAKVMHMIAETGQAIIIGRGAPLILRGPKILNVRITESFESRNKRLQKEEELSYTQAEIEIAEMDSARTQFVEDYFEQDLYDPEHYDIVINTEYISFDETAALVVAAFNAKVGGVA